MVMREIISDSIASGKFWTHPWGLIRGCSSISPGCANCWLVRMARLAGDHDLLTPDQKHFNGQIRCMEGVLTAPLASRKRKPRVWAIWSDFYHPDVPDYFRDNAFEVMSQCPSDYFLIMTKRPHVAFKYFSERLCKAPLPNVIHLITMENAKMMKKRAIWTRILAVLGWDVGVLAEPLLGPFDIVGRNTAFPEGNKFLKWIITGPENGPGKRPFDPAWAIDLRDQAKAVGVPFFYKDDKGFIPGGGMDKSLEVPDL